MYRKEITTQTPRSSFQQNPRSVLYPKSELHDVIDPTKGNLRQQRKDLKVKKEKLIANIQEIEEQRQKVLRQSGIVQDLEEDFRLMRQIPIFRINGKVKEANRQRSILAKFGTDLKQHIEFLENQLDEATYQLNQINEQNQTGELEEVDTMQIVEQRIREQEIQLKELQAMKDALDSEILSRENEVIQLEMKAEDHLQLIEKVKETKNELLYRKYEALHKKEVFASKYKDIEEQQKAITKKMESANVKLSDAKSYSSQLEREEIELNDREKLLKSKIDELQKLQIERSQQKIKEVRRKMKMKESRELDQLNEMRFLAKEEDELLYEIGEIEFQIVNDQKEVNVKSDSLMITKDSMDKAYDARKSKLQVLVDDIQEKLKDKKSVEELKNEIIIAKNVVELITNDTKEKKNEIDEIKSKLTPEDQVDFIKKELQKQMKDAIIQEREVNSKLGAVEAEERETINDEEEMKRNLSLIEAEISMTNKNYAAISSMLKISQEQTETLKKRYEIFLEAQQKIQNSNIQNE